MKPDLKDSPALQLMLEAATEALKNAGLAPKDNPSPSGANPTNN